jgi:hypothetical protein
MLLNNDNFKMQGGVRNYLGKTQEVTAPKFWQSSENSPPTELAYITEAEKGLLLDANLHGSLKNNQPNIGASGLLSFDGWGSEDPGQNRPDPQSDRDREVGGSSTGGGSQFHGIATPSSQNNDDIDSTYTSTSFEITPKKSKIDQIKEFFQSGGVIGNIAKGFEPMSKAIQAKAMTWSFNKKLKNIYEDNPDFEDYESLDEIPGEIGEKIRNYEKDLQGVKDGTFTQKDYTAKYGSGDATNPLDASFNPATLKDNDRQELENLFASELSYAIGDTTPQNSIVNEYFANMNNQNLGINSAYMDTYNKAKTNMAAKLNLTANTQQYGYNNTFQNNYGRSMDMYNPFFNELTDQGLI